VSPYVDVVSPIDRIYGKLFLELPRHTHGSLAGSHLFVSGTRHFSIILFSKAFVFQLFTVIPPYVQLIWDFFIWSDLV